MAKRTLRQASAAVEVRTACVKMGSFVQIWSYPSGEVGSPGVRAACTECKCPGAVVRS
jgi:hypothetical protein